MRFHSFYLVYIVRPPLFFPRHSSKRILFSYSLLKGFCYFQILLCDFCSVFGKKFLSISIRHDIYVYKCRFMLPLIDVIYSMPLHSAAPHKHTATSMLHGQHHAVSHYGNPVQAIPTPPRKTPKEKQFNRLIFMFIGKVGVLWHLQRAIVFFLDAVHRDRHHALSLTQSDQSPKHAFPDKILLPSDTDLLISFSMPGSVNVSSFHRLTTAATAFRLLFGSLLVLSHPLAP